MLEYRWKARVISGNRITIPRFIVEDWGLKEGDRVYVVIRRVPKERGVILP